jgi:hypothetical protein
MTKTISDVIPMYVNSVNRFEKLSLLSGSLSKQSHATDDGGGILLDKIAKF